MFEGEPEFTSDLPPLTRRVRAVVAEKIAALSALPIYYIIIVQGIVITRSLRGHRVSHRANSKMQESWNQAKKCKV